MAVSFKSTQALEYLLQYCVKGVSVTHSISLLILPLSISHPRRWWYSLYAYESKLASYISTIFCYNQKMPFNLYLFFFQFYIYLTVTLKVLFITQVYWLRVRTITVMIKVLEWSISNARRFLNEQYGYKLYIKICSKMIFQ